VEQSGDLRKSMTSLLKKWWPTVEKNYTLNCQARENFRCRTQKRLDERRRGIREFTKRKRPRGRGGGKGKGVTQGMGGVTVR